MGIPCIGLNGGPEFTHNEAFSFQVTTADQEETDRYWHAIVGNGGEASMCGWCKDKWGVSWQITPLALTEATTDPDPAAAKRAFDAMMQMKNSTVVFWIMTTHRHGVRSGRCLAKRWANTTSAGCPWSSRSWT
jgi:predicted 3-demethylubiquinone-9 3-methyltransferase (glyoxalase superfamily)